MWRVSCIMKNRKIKNLLLSLLIVYVSYIFINQQKIMHRQKVEFETYTVELEKVQEENKKLQDEVQLSKTDKYIEKLAREKLGLIKEGETPVINNSVKEDK